MLIEIIGAYDEIAWYSKLVGKQFEVIDSDMSAVKVKRGNGRYSYWVFEKDYKVIQRLDNETWVNIFRNLKEMDEEDFYDGEVNWVEVMWLDGSDEWCLCYGEEMFEDGFKSEKEAQERLNYLENKLLK